jgi:glycosyltransferase involved in cell wall biosynthesis
MSSLKKIKIVYMDHIDNIGGGQRRLVSLISAIVEKGGIIPVVILSEKNKILIEELSGFGIKIYPIKLNRYKKGIIADESIRSAISQRGLTKHIWTVIRELCRIIQHENPDIIYANTFKTSLLLSLMYRSFRAKTIYAILSARELSSHGILDRIVLRCMDGFIFNSEYTKSTYNGLISRNKKNAVVYSYVPNPTTLLSPLSERIKLRAKIAPHGEKIIGYIGRINPRKRVEDFIRMARLLLNERVDKRFVLVGGYSPEQAIDYYPKIVSMANDLLNNAVIFTGHVSNPFDYLSVFDVFVLPSLKEPLGRVLIEAVFLGVPIVAIDSGGVNEILKNVKFSTLVPPKSPIGLAKAAKNMLNYKRNYSKEEWGNIPKSFKSKFFKESILSKELKLYNKLLSQ